MKCATWMLLRVPYSDIVALSRPVLAVRVYRICRPPIKLSMLVYRACIIVMPNEKIRFSPSISVRITYSTSCWLWSFYEGIIFPARSSL